MAKSLAFFISPHGFGHAARACSVMQSLQTLSPDIRFLILTTVPHWFFFESLAYPFTYIPLVTDIGLVQKTPLQEDLDETLKRLQAFFPLRANGLDKAARTVEEQGCDLIVSDISPLGIGVANDLGLPSVLIENFTWDWIYRGYQKDYPEFEKTASYLQDLYKQATYHLLAQPYCDANQSDLITNPICRSPRNESGQIRNSLGIDSGSRVVLITMGGIPETYQNRDLLYHFSDTVFLIPGGNSELEKEKNVISFPHHSQYYHPDLIAASDAVVGKIGYSTLAEAYQSGKPFGYIPRTGFRESHQLEAFIQTQMAGVKITAADYRDGNWLNDLQKLLDLPFIERRETPGAEQAAAFILKKLSGFP